MNMHRPVSCFSLGASVHNHDSRHIIYYITMWVGLGLSCMGGIAGSSVALVRVLVRVRVRMLMRVLVLMLIRVLMRVLMHDSARSQHCARDRKLLQPDSHGSGRSTIGVGKARLKCIFHHDSYCRGFGTHQAV